MTFWGVEENQNYIIWTRIKRKKNILIWGLEHQIKVPGKSRRGQSYFQLLITFRLNWVSGEAISQHKINCPQVLEAFFSSTTTTTRV